MSGLRPRLRGDAQEGDARNDASLPRVRKTTGGVGLVHVCRPDHWRGGVRWRLLRFRLKLIPRGRRPLRVTTETQRHQATATPSKSERLIRKGLLWVFPCLLSHSGRSSGLRVLMTLWWRYFCSCPPHVRNPAPAASWQDWSLTPPTELQKIAGVSADRRVFSESFNPDNAGARSRTGLHSQHDKGDVWPLHTNRRF